MSVWAVVAALALLLCAGVYCTKLDHDKKQAMCREIMQNGTPEAKSKAVETFGACHS